MRITLPARAVGLVALCLFATGAARAQGGLASLVAVGAQNLYITPSSVSTNFDDIPAPCSFDDAAPLINQLSGVGLTFSGGGSVLNQCSNVIVQPSQANNNFLAFPASNTPATETINFAEMQSMFLFTIIGSPMVSVAAMMHEDLVAAGSFGFEGGQPQSIVIQNSMFNSIIISGGGDMQPWALDNFYFTPSAAVTTTAPEPTTLILLACGLCAVAVFTRRKDIHGE